jgi:hypothetical protein
MTPRCERGGQIGKVLRRGRHVRVKGLIEEQEFQLLSVSLRRPAQIPRASATVDFDRGFRGFRG